MKVDGSGIINIIVILVIKKLIIDEWQFMELTEPISEIPTCIDIIEMKNCTYLLLILEVVRMVPRCTQV